MLWASGKTNGISCKGILKKTAIKYMINFYSAGGDTMSVIAIIPAYNEEKQLEGSMNQKC